MFQGQMSIRKRSSGLRRVIGARRNTRQGVPVWLLAILAAAGLSAPVAWSVAQAASSADSPKSAQVAASANAASGAEGTKPGNQTRIRVRVNEVNIPVTVLSKRGVPVIDLTPKDFEIFEDGQRQTIKYFYRGERPPLRIGVILDTSNSARPQLKFEKDSAAEFAFNMLQGRSSKNQIFLQSFDSQSSVIQDFTNDPNVLNEKIRHLKAGGGKALYDAIYFACREKMLPLGPRAQTRRVLVVLSDGLDVESGLHEFLSHDPEIADAAAFD